MLKQILMICFTVGLVQCKSLQMISSRTLGLEPEQRDECFLANSIQMEVLLAEYGKCLNSCRNAYSRSSSALEGNMFNETSQIMNLSSQTRRLYKECEEKNVPMEFFKCYRNLTDSAPKSFIEIRKISDDGLKYLQKEVNRFRRTKSECVDGCVKQHEKKMSQVALESLECLRKP